jgi:hypothetical protein
MSSANVGSAKIKSANVASRLLLIDVPSSSECFRIMSEFDLQYSFSIQNQGDPFETPKMWLTAPEMWQKYGI